MALFLLRCAGFCFNFLIIISVFYLVTFLSAFHSSALEIFSIVSHLYFIGYRAIVIHTSVLDCDVFIGNFREKNGIYYVLLFWYNCFNLYALLLQYCVIS